MSLLKQKSGPREPLCTSSFHVNILVASSTPSPEGIPRDLGITSSTLSNEGIHADLRIASSTLEREFCWSVCSILCSVWNCSAPLNLHTGIPLPRMGIGCWHENALMGASASALGRSASGRASGAHPVRSTHATRVPRVRVARPSRSKSPMRTSVHLPAKARRVLCAPACLASR